MVGKQKGIAAGTAVLIVAVVAAVACGGLYLVTQLQRKSKEEAQWAEAIENHIRNLYPSDDVGYEITSKSENRVKGFVYLRGENDWAPFEDMELKLENGHWNLYPGPWDTTVRSPSKNLEITGYSIDKCSVGSSEWSGERRCLDKIRPTVRNGSNYPAFVSSVCMRIENSTDTFTRSYPAGVIFIGRISIGIIPSGRTVEVGYRGGPALIPKWSSGGSKSFLRMDELAGENFHITLTLKDGEGTTLAKRTFHKTFENPPVSNLVEENRFVSSNLEREKNPDVSQNQMSELVDGNTQFAFDLYQQIRDKKGNLFYSPYSISTALSMTYAGARGETAQQMGDTLHFTLPQEQLHPSFNALSQSLDERENFTLKLANALWGQENWRFKENFLDTLALNYGAGIHRLDFWEKPKQASRIVNEWVENHTENKIENLVPSGAFKGLPTVLVLTNAIYFRAPWEHSFPEDQTRERAFTLPNGENVKVPMMSSGPRSLLCTEGKNYKAVKIPYLGNGSMTIILPDEGHFREVERDLDAEFVEGVEENFKEHTLTLKMPKFGFESKFDLSKALKEMGMPIAFTREANFSGMTPDTPVWIDQVLHKAHISVDEKGTEAAAATSVEIVMGIGPKITLDRPFIFLIRDDETGTVLFAGRVINPVA